MHPYKDPSTLFLPAVALLLTLGGCVNLVEMEPEPGFTLSPGRFRASPLHGGAV